MITYIIAAIRNADLYSLISLLLSAAVLLLVCLPLHELAHAYTAHRLGDNTAKYMGRLTLNPLKHLDPLGSAMIILVGFGYAKPVPVNMNNFKNRKRDMAITALAGPVANFSMAIIFTFLTVLTIFIYSKLNVQSLTTFYIFNMLYGLFQMAAQINVCLAIFNLIPVPPFDGSRILGYFLPDRIYYKIMQYEQQIFIIVLILMATSFQSRFLSTVYTNVYNGLYDLISLPFGV